MTDQNKSIDNENTCKCCGQATYPPDTRNAIQKCLSMLADYMQVPSDNPTIKDATDLHDDLVAALEKYYKIVSGILSARSVVPNKDINEHGTHVMQLLARAKVESQ